MHLLPIFLLFALAVVSHAKQEFTEIIGGYTQLMAPSREKCIKESNVNPELIEKLLNLGEFPDNRELKCYAKCFLINTDVIDAAGQVVNENVRKNVGLTEPVAAEKLYNKCKGAKGADLCETAFEICKCIYQGAKVALQEA